MKERVAGTEAGKGDLGKAEMLNAERAVANATQTDKAANRGTKSKEACSAERRNLTVLREFSEVFP